METIIEKELQYSFLSVPSSSTYDDGIYRPHSKRDESSRGFGAMLGEYCSDISSATNGPELPFWRLKALGSRRYVIYNTIASVPGGL